MYYPENLVEEVRQKSDIVDVISSYVRLTKKGSTYFGLCPFHNEKTGSFSVTPSKQMYYCFGCGAGGNVFTFIKEYENFSFPEAMQFLAKRAGVALPEIDEAEERKKDNKRQRLLDINREAGKYYYAMLRNPAGQRAYEYFKGRGLSDETMKKFGLGFARAGQDETYRYLKSKGFEDTELIDSGLFNRSKNGYGFMDKFWNRAIFPIMDVNHRIIGFGGRVMGEGEPKYLNSPETLIFDKGRNLYGLNHARTSRSKYMILVEGYMDVISLHQAGFNQAVASLGTALTSGQANLLKRYVSNVYLCQDSDEAGIKAKLRALPILREAGLTAKVINMEPYKDPDEFIKGLGAEEFKKRIENAENAFYYEVRMEERNYDLKDPEEKTRFLSSVAKMLLRFDEELERETYIGAISGKYNISVESLTKLVNRLAMQGEGITVREAPKSGIRSERDPNQGVKEAQGLLITLLCDEPSLYETVKKHVSVNDFTEDIYKRVAGALFEQLDRDDLNPGMIVDLFEDDDEQHTVASLFHASFEVPKDPAEKQEYLNSLLGRIKKNGVEYRAREDKDESIEALQKLLNDSKEAEDIEIKKHQ